MPDVVLAGRAISKSFGQVQVLFGVDFAIRRGEIHALMGENGAGKSTLMKILGGYQPASAGTVEVDGAATVLRDSGDAERLGIVMIHQEFSLAETMTVEENIYLGREVVRHGFLDRATMREGTRKVLAELECPVDPDARVGGLSVSEKQMVEIAKAVSRDVRVLIMDEPTAVLTGAETEILFRLIRRLTAQGVGVAYISHKLTEVKAISDRVTVLRDGRWVETRPTAELSPDDIARLMVGREISDMYPPRLPPPDDAPTVLAVDHLSIPGWVRDASFTLRRGEILGFAGLVGAGRTELMEGLVGLRRRTAGEVRATGVAEPIRTIDQAVAAGIAYLTEDRKGKGLLVDKPLTPNLTLLALARYGRIFVDRAAERRALVAAIAEHRIKTADLDARVASLSGGNQQKLLIAKTMQVEPKILIVDEPTRGIDVGTKHQIYLFLAAFVAAGGSVVIISSELPELIGLAHRVVVMRDGRITGTLSGADIEENEVVRHATGLKGAHADA
ncbi:sugar ABC transporter ATP-binding protein [Siculibacillus lacustris]|uniref:Sugar ABC transporter ATP-binding protein n=1 Tax=Siculibacillus lacustris TaxID=1549641 RepID=A0A4Q9VXN4_9HYPH|nr:sugar ABC transporter ATP-binding protein [Siculibacillus lacustris]TBW40684.1 sugar ABC transporter ATP-binding protein [Siculibacillus lacustris]